MLVLFKVIRVKTKTIYNSRVKVYL